MQMKKLFILFTLILSLGYSHSQNVGIGTATPAYKLDIAGRLRIQSGTNTAGIWLDGTTLPTRSFIGTIDDDHVGIWGNGGIGWNIAMNVDNGNTGIGTAAPTAKLDINGTLRIRSSIPKKGSIITSNDADGNASWMDPVAFRAAGLPNGANVNIQDGAWVKVMFNTSPSYNLGLNYSPFLSQFIVAEKGIYHFNTQLSFYYDHIMLGNNVRIRVNRNGTNIDIARYDRTHGLGEGSGELIRLPGVANVSTDALLEVGDIVFVEVYCSNVKSQDQTTLNYATLYGNSYLTWFAGHLVARL